MEEDIMFDSEEFKKSDSYEHFMDENSAMGTLKIQASTANQAFPLEGVVIQVSKDVDGKHVVFFTGVTDESGIVDGIELPAVPSKEDVKQKEDIVYTRYDVMATYPKSNIKKLYEVAVFDNIKVIQPVKIPMMTLMEGEQN